MYSTELRSTFSQELGAALHFRLTYRLVEWASDNTLAPTVRNKAQRILDMLTTSYDCAILNPFTGTHEMVVPAVLLLSDDKNNMDIPLLVLMVDFSKKPDDQTVSRLLYMYPSATVIRANVPYVRPEDRVAAHSADNVLSAYSCSYDVIVRASTAAATAASHNEEAGSWSWPPLRFLARNRSLLQHQKDNEESSLEIPLSLLLPELTWRVASSHPAAAVAGQLTIRLPSPSLRRSLTLAAVRQKNKDILRLKTRNTPLSSVPRFGDLCPSSARGLHTLVFPSTAAPAHTPTRTHAFDAGGKGYNGDLSTFPRVHGLGLKPARFGFCGFGTALAVAGSGAHHNDMASLRSLFCFGWRLARRGRG